MNRFSQQPQTAGEGQGLGALPERQTLMPFASAILKLAQANPSAEILDVEPLATMTAAGEPAGRVKLVTGDGAPCWAPFVGTVILSTIGNAEILDCADIQLTPDGEPAGRVQIPDGSDAKWVPFKGSVLFERLGAAQLEVIDCCNISARADGWLAGEVELADRRRVPFLAAAPRDALVFRTLRGEEVDNCDNIRVSGGKIAGRVVLSDGESFPFFDGAVMKQLGSVQLDGYCDHIHTTKDGELAGQVLIGGRRVSLFLARHAATGIPAIDAMLKAGGIPPAESRLPSADKPWASALLRLCQANPRLCVIDFDSLAMTGKGEVIGRVLLDEGQAEEPRWVPFRGVTILAEMNGQTIIDCGDVQPTSDDGIAGRVQLLDGPWVPFKNKTAFLALGENTERNTVLGCECIHGAPMGKIAGRAVLTDGRAVAFIGAGPRSTVLFETIGGEEIVDCADIQVTPAGELAGRVQLLSGVWVPFLGAAPHSAILIKTVGQEDTQVVQCNRIQVLPDCALSGEIVLDGGRCVSLLLARAS